MKILQMHRNLGAGGIEAFVFHLSNELVENNEVTICTINQPNNTDHFYSNLLPNIRRETIGKKPDSNPIFTVFKIYKYIKNGDFDIVQLHGFFYFYSLAILLLHKRTRFFYTVHSDAIKENNPWDIRLLFIKKFFFRKEWLLPITISPASQESFKQLYNCSSRMIYNGISAPIIDDNANLRKEFIFADSTKIFIHAGRISPEKNQEMLCKVFESLIKENEDVALLIAGPIHNRNIYNQMANYFSDRILYIGERDDVPGLMSQCEGMCLCSQYEGMPIVLIESMAVGCIPICTPVGGIVNVISNGENGFLSSEVSEESYYKAMKSFLDDSESHIKQMKENCKSSFKKYDIKLTAKNYMDYYDSTLHSVHP